MKHQDDLVRDTGCRPRQLERLVEFGLLHREQQWPARHRGSSTRYDRDAAARVSIIQKHLADGHTLLDTAFELVLQGYDLHKPTVLRRVLSDFVDRQIDLTARYLCEPTVADDNASAARARLQRKLRTFSDREGLSPDAHDTLVISALGMTGVMPQSRNGILLPSDALMNVRRWRGLLDSASTTDARLAQAVGDAREALGRDAEWFTSSMGTYFNFSPEDLVRAFLPGHICKTRHSVAQALLPHSILGYIDPLSSSDEATRAGPAFLVLLASGTAEIGGRFGNLTP